MRDGDRDSEYGREAEFTAFFHAHFGTVRDRVLRLGHSEADADDICSGVFTLAHQRFDALAPLAEPQVRAWLFRTGDLLGRNHRRSAIRYRRLIERLEREPLPDPIRPAELHNAEQSRRRASAQTRQVLASLGPHHRRVLELAELERLSGPEIAREMGVSHQAVRLRLMRARRAFGQEYTRQFGAGYVGESHDARW